MFNWWLGAFASLNLMPPPELKRFLDEIHELPEFVGLGDKVTGPTARGLFGTTPLHVAAVRGDVHIIGLLLDAGSEIDARGEYGHTPLHEAIGHGHTDAVRLLLARGADTAIRNDWRQAAAEIARSGGNHEIESLFSREG